MRRLVTVIVPLCLLLGPTPQVGPIGIDGSYSCQTAVLGPNLTIAWPLGLGKEDRADGR